ncbi:uncharacterized protein LOC121861797 [Homarus americanus]|uniref:uncharacterized protein LOC121861797 n=1 Tax=Homarus americanus TaxID=6706 RepID=UPI001C451CFA|nr:uncharacterized protein LOC121861797 [Homarus americanus]
MLEFAALRLLEQLEHLHRPGCRSPRHAQCAQYVTGSARAGCSVQCNVSSVDHAWCCTHCDVCQVCLQSQPRSPVDSLPRQRTIRQSAPSALTHPAATPSDTTTAGWIHRGVSSPSSSHRSTIPSPSSSLLSETSPSPSPVCLTAPTPPTATPSPTFLFPGASARTAAPSPHTSSIPDTSLSPPALSLSPTPPALATSPSASLSPATFSTVLPPSVSTPTQFSTAVSTTSDNPSRRGDDKTSSLKVTSHGRESLARDDKVDLKSLTPPDLRHHKSRSTLRTGRGSQASVQVVRTAVVMLALLTTTTAAYQLKPTTTASKITLAGLTAKLPCELPVPADKPTLILWYKDAATKPFYSYDARDRTRGKHKVHDNSRLGWRSRFTLETIPHNYRTRMGFLEVENVSLADAGNYTCRVDFMTSQTLMSLLQLTVHEGIRSLEIFDAYETMISQVAGPYKISSRVVLSCRAYGGYPPPVVKWLSGEEVVGRSWTQPQEDLNTIPYTGTERHHQTMSVVSATLVMQELTREDNGRQLKCVAANTNLTQDRSRLVTIEMYLPPVEVVVEGVEGPLRAGVEATLVCRASGSRPPATLTWQIDGSNGLTPLPPQSSLDLNTTFRRARLLPTPEDNGRTVTCTATNSKVDEYFLSTSTTLRVHFAPEVEARLAPALDPNNIEEGDDVYFECQIRANPPESRVLWLHQGRQLHTDKEKRVLAQGRNLVLQRVNRHARGSYQCSVTNPIDTVTSAPTPLDVMCEYLKVEFMYNESVYEENIMRNRIVLMGDEWEVGIKGWTWRPRPILPVGGPAPSCTAQTLTPTPTISTVSSSAWAVTDWAARRSPACSSSPQQGPQSSHHPARWSTKRHLPRCVLCSWPDGDLKQYFVTTVRDAATQETVANVSSPTPTFAVGGLAPGRDYLLLVTAVNTKGRSVPYVIQGFALKVAENKINNSSSTESSPLLAVFVGVVSGFVFILTVLAVATRSRCRRRRGVPDAAATTNDDNTKLRDVDEVPPSPSTKASLDGAEDADDELNTPESQDGPLEPQDITTQSAGSPTSVGSTRTYVPRDSITRASSS